MKIWTPVNAHAPIKDGNVVSYYCVLLWTGKKAIKKTQAVDEDFVDNGEKNSPFFIQKLIPADETLLQILLKVKDTYVYLLWLPTY